MAKCKWRRADNKRQPGWEAIRQRLVGIDGVPMLYFSDQCEDTIRTLPTLQHEEKNPEDLDTDAEDHAADELRYACMSRPWKPAMLVPPKGLTLPLLPTEMTINQLVERTKHKRILREMQNA
jgi:hypothetical protein